MCVWLQSFAACADFSPPCGASAGQHARDDSQGRAKLARIHREASVPTLTPGSSLPRCPVCSPGPQPHGPGERLLPRVDFERFSEKCGARWTEWWSGVDSNPRYREGFYGREFGRSLAQYSARQKHTRWREFVRLEFDSASALSGSFRSPV